MISWWSQIFDLKFNTADHTIAVIHSIEIYTILLEKLEKHKMESIFIDPTPETKQTIYLDENKTAFLTLEFLPEHLMKHTQDNFELLFELRHGCKQNIVQTDCNGKAVDFSAYRYYQSYLNTPKLDINNLKTNYMFSDLNNNDNRELPALLHELYDYINTTDIYNQVVVNWYEPTHFIKPHVDWTEGMTKGSNIAMLTVTPYASQCRTMKIKRVNQKLQQEKYREAEIVLKHGLIIKLHGNAITDLKHGIQIGERKSRRIGITFRHFEN